MDEEIMLGMANATLRNPEVTTLLARVRACAVINYLPEELITDHDKELIRNAQAHDTAAGILIQALKLSSEPRKIEIFVKQLQATQRLEAKKLEAKHQELKQQYRPTSPKRLTVKPMLAITQGEKTDDVAGLYKASVDMTLTKEDLENVDKIMELICLIEFNTPTGKIFGTGFYLGQCTDADKRRVGCVLVSHHVLKNYLPDLKCNQLQALASFGYFHRPTNTFKQNNITSFGLPTVLDENERLDYVVFVMENKNEQPLSNHPQGVLKYFIQPKVPEVKAFANRLHVFGHPDSREMQFDTAEVIQKSDIVGNERVRDARLRGSGCHLDFLNDDIYVYYQCSMFHGSSGSPCFNLLNGQVKLICVHKGGLYIDNNSPQTGDKSDYECGVFMGCIMKAINKTFSQKNIHWVK